MISSIIIQASAELKIYFRDKVQVFFGFFFPVFILILFASIFSGTKVEGIPYIDYIMPGMFAVTIMTTSFFTVGATIAGYKENLIMKKLRATPMKLSNFLLAVVFSRVFLLVLQTSIMWMVAALFFEADFRGNVIVFAYTFILSSILFLTLGFTIASLVKTFNAAIAVANFLYLGLVFVSAAFFPITRFPLTVQHIIRAFPLIHIVEPLRKIWLDGTWMPFSALNLIIIFIWLVAGFAISVLKFKWE